MLAPGAALPDRRWLFRVAPASLLSPAEKVTLWLALPHLVVAGMGARVGVPATTPAVVAAGVLLVRAFP